MRLYPNAEKFMAKKPTKIGMVAGVSYYEHPIHGDESPLWAITSEGKLKKTDFYDLPSAEEIFDFS